MSSTGTTDSTDSTDSTAAGASDPTDPHAIEADIEATRARLAGTVDELAVRMHPKEIARRSADDARTRLRAATTTPDGRPRVERLAAVGVAAVAVLSAIVWRRRR